MSSPFQYESRQFQRIYSETEKVEPGFDFRQAQFVRGLLEMHAAMTEGTPLYDRDGKRIDTATLAFTTEAIVVVISTFDRMYKAWRQVDPHMTRIANDIIVGEL